MNKQIYRLGILFIIAFVALGLNLTYLQVWAAPGIISHPRNTRGIANELAIERGQIVTGDGLVIAESKKAGTQYQRRYPEESLYAHLTGYYSIRYGRSSLERIYNEELLGKKELSSVEDYIKSLMDGRQRGHTLVLTVNSRLQKTAARAIGNQRGAVVALNPKTGEVLAMVSNPSFDPNRIAGLDSQVSERAWKDLTENPERPLINRATQEWYPPGSTFKVLTASAALESGIADPASIFNCTGRLKLPLTTHTIKDFGGKSHGEISLEDALRVSCNNTFGELGLKLGKDKLVYYAERFGINREVPFELPVTESIIPADLDEPSTALSAIGQKDVRLTPLQMALMTGAIANSGEIMKPFIVKEIRDYDGKVIRNYEGEKWLTAISAENASIMAEMLRKVVDSGTGKAAKISGIEVAGKTGTAQVPGQAPHAWFTCFAPVNDPQIAVTVVIENGGSMGNEATGGRIAAPIAREVVLEALNP